MVFEALRLTSVLLLVVPPSLFLWRSVKQDGSADTAVLSFVLGLVFGLFLVDFLFFLSIFL